MKKNLLTLISVMVCSTVFSQTTYSEIRPQVVEEIEAFYKKKVATGEIVSSSDISNAKNKLSKDLTALTATVTQINNRTSENTRVLDKKELIEHFGDYSSSAFALINVIASSFKQNDIQLYILELNNPTDDALGFSLKGVMNELVDKLILKKMGVKNEEAAKFSGIVNAIIESPITKVLGSAVPAINNVVNFISNLTIGNKKLTPDDLKNFMAKVNEYFRFYELLAANNKDFKSNMYELNVKAEALRLVLKNFIMERTKIYFDETISKEDLSNINKVMAEYLTQSKIKSRYKKLIIGEDGKEKENEQIDKIEALKMPSTTVSQAQYLIDEIESLANQYINAYAKYITSVNESLDAAKTLKDADGKQFVDSKVIADKQKDFLKKLETWEEAFKNSLNIVTIRDVVSQMTKLKPF